MIIKIDPLDTFFFRDGKPFSMGEDTWADGVFPPYPSMFYGALRSVFFSNYLDEFKKANEDADPTNRLKIKGIFLLREDTVYFPLPLDCIRKKNSEKGLFSVLLMHELGDVRSSCPTQNVLKSSERVESVDGGLIDLESLKEYLKGTENSFSSILRLADMVSNEPKIGITIDEKTGKAKEGMLYRVDMKRLENLSFIIDFDGLDLPERGMMKLGGEGKAASYRKFKSPDLPTESPAVEAKRFKIYLSTPAIFKGGWLPEWIDENSLVGEYEGLKLRLLTASIGKPIGIGGFDMKARKPKPMYKAVPAGSVYYFDIIKGNYQKAYIAFNQQAISDSNPEQGFGIAYVGGVRDS